jgi:hypothetical protein
MFRFNHHHQGARYLRFAEVKVQIVRSLMVVIKSKYFGAILM